MIQQRGLAGKSSRLNDGRRAAYMESRPMVHPTHDTRPCFREGLIHPDGFCAISTPSLSSVLPRAPLSVSVSSERGLGAPLALPPARAHPV